MKASMMRSRSDRSSLAGARRVTGFALDLRAMTELPGLFFLASM
jgi:hypothetical protein